MTSPSMPCANNAATDAAARMRAPGGQSYQDSAAGARSTAGGSAIDDDPKKEVIYSGLLLLLRSVSMDTTTTTTTMNPRGVIDIIRTICVVLVFTRFKRMRVPSDRSRWRVHGLVGWAEQLSMQFGIDTATSFGSRRFYIPSQTAGLCQRLRVGRRVRPARINTFFFGITVRGAATRSRLRTYCWVLIRLTTGCTHPCSRVSAAASVVVLFAQRMEGLVMQWKLELVGQEQKVIPVPEQPTVVNLSPINYVTHASDWCLMGVM